MRKFEVTSHNPIPPQLRELLLTAMQRHHAECVSSDLTRWVVEGGGLRADDIQALYQREWSEVIGHPVSVQAREIV